MENKWSIKSRAQPDRGSPCRMKWIALADADVRVIRVTGVTALPQPHWI